MEKESIPGSTLFFHMGPGFHARIEAQTFSGPYPHVAFLDQPLNVDFVELGAWAKKEIERFFSLTKSPVTICAHSFGAHVFLDALSSIPEMIGEVRLLNSAYDPFDCFANLQSYFEPQAPGRKYWKTRDPSEKMQLIFQLVQNPNMPDAYWVNQRAYETYRSVSRSLAPLDTSTFIKVFSQFLSLQATRSTPEWKGRVRLLYSLEDKLLQDFEVVAPWVKIFPQLQYTKFDGVGHQAHFESTEVAQLFFRG